MGQNFRRQKPNPWSAMPKPKIPKIDMTPIVITITCDLSNGTMAINVNRSVPYLTMADACAMAASQCIKKAGLSESMIVGNGSGAPGADPESLQPGADPESLQPGADPESLQPSADPESPAETGEEFIARMKKNLNGGDNGE